MEVNRNQYFMAGMVILLLGIQFRLVDSFVLNAPTTQFLSEKIPRLNLTNKSPSIFALPGPQWTPAAARQMRPPEWLGWAFLSVGAVLILHSLAMRKPD